MFFRITFLRNVFKEILSIQKTKMFKFGECWKCNTMQNSKILNHKLPFHLCQHICEYDKCDTCRNKLETMNNFDEDSYLSRATKRKE